MRLPSLGVLSPKKKAWYATYRKFGDLLPRRLAPPPPGRVVELQSHEGRSIAAEEQNQDMNTFFNFEKSHSS
jgi:hypothetical protein